MMRAPRSFAVVVRRRNGSLHVRERAIADTRKGFANLPLVRGVASLVESLRLGGEALRFSAEQAEKDMAEEDMAAAKGAKSTAGLSLLSALGYTLYLLATQEPEPIQKASAPLASAEKPAENPAEKLAEKPAEKRAGGPALMLAMMVLFMVALPQIIAAVMNRVFHLDLEVQSPRFQAMTGVFKILMVVGYLLAIRRVPDIRRVFQYHGAEHKTISTYEAGEELTVQNARAKSTLHPRCGTTFLVMVALVSVLVFTGVGSFLPRIHTGSAILDNIVFFIEKLPFVPVIAALTFEMQRVFARHFTRGPLRLVLMPGFLVQKITTIEPDDDQLEIALASLRATLFRAQEGVQEGGRGEATPDVLFPSYEAFYAAGALRDGKAA